jgi:hypothetical protein
VRAHAARMTDACIVAEISRASIFAVSSFCVSSSQLPAVGDRTLPYLRPELDGAERAFRDDTLQYSLCSFDLQPLEGMLVDVNRRLKRSRAFDQGRVQGHLVAAVDGIEVLSRFSRCCDSCLKRRVTSKKRMVARSNRLSTTIARSVARWSIAPSKRFSLSNGCDQQRARTRLHCGCSGSCPTCTVADFSTSY